MGPTETGEFGDECAWETEDSVGAVSLKVSLGVSIGEKPINQECAEGDDQSVEYSPVRGPSVALRCERGARFDLPRGDPHQNCPRTLHTLRQISGTFPEIPTPDSTCFRVHPGDFPKPGSDGLPVHSGHGRE